MYALPHVFGVFPGSLQPSLRMSIFMEEPDNQTKRQTNSLNFYFNNKLNGWIALKATSDWLLKLRKSFAIHIRATRPRFHPKNLSDREPQGGLRKFEKVLQTCNTIQIKQNRKHVGEEEIEVDPMSCYPEKKRIKIKKISIYLYTMKYY